MIYDLPSVDPKEQEEATGSKETTGKEKSRSKLTSLKRVNGGRGRREKSDENEKRSLS